MKTFAVDVVLTGSVTVTVEAEDEFAAMTEARLHAEVGEVNDWSARAYTPREIKQATLDEFRDRGDQPGEVWKLTGQDSVHSALQAEASEQTVGRCGDPLSMLVPGVPEARVHCLLPHGHEGWHRSDDGTEWTGGPKK